MRRALLSASAAALLLAAAGCNDSCSSCGAPVFDSATKYESGSGWPSFWQPMLGAVGTSTDGSHFMTRTEVHCAQCGGHLGHVFPDGPKPSGQRYCMNGAALKFDAKK